MGLLQRFTAGSVEDAMHWPHPQKPPTIQPEVRIPLQGAQQPGTPVTPKLDCLRGNPAAVRCLQMRPGSKFMVCPHQLNVAYPAQS